MLNREDLNSAQDRISAISSLLGQLQVESTDQELHHKDLIDTVNLIRAELVRLDADLHRFVTGR